MLRLQHPEVLSLCSGTDRCCVMHRITVWSLTSKSFVYISGPKHAAKGLKFSPDGKYMAVAEVLSNVYKVECYLSR